MTVLHVDELERIETPDGFVLRPIRGRFGIEAFGVDAYSPSEAGAQVVEDHGERRLQTVVHLRRAPVHVTLVDRRNFHLFQPLTYQVATGALSPGEIAYPLRAIFKRDENVRVLMAEVADFDLEAHELRLRSAGGLP